MDWTALLGPVEFCSVGLNLVNLIWAGQFVGYCSCCVDDLILLGWTAALVEGFDEKKTHLGLLG